MTKAKTYRLALAEAQRRYPDATGEELDSEVDDILHDWAAESAGEREYMDDTPCIENGRDNCNDWGTGEGRFHGRI